MKKLVYISLIALAGFTTSCSDDLLETYAPGQITSDVAFQSSSDLRAMLNSAYGVMANRSESEFVSVFTDEVGIGYANGGQGLTDDYVFFLAPFSAGPTNIWSNNYLALARINRVIEFADKVTPKDPADAAVIAGLKAQALTMRAYCHLNILSYFTTDMKSDAALAGIISNRIFGADDNDYPRNTNGEFYSLIHSDLDAAINTYTTIPGSNPAAASASAYANSNFAKGLKARAYAYKGDYANAETWANTVIASSGVSLATKTQYNGVFLNESNPQSVEVIFELKRTPAQNNQDTNLHNAWASIRPDLNGSPFYEVSRALHNKLNPSNAPATALTGANMDIRANTIIAPSSLIDPGYATSANYRDSDVIVINKHGGTATAGTATWATTGTNQNNNDFKIMRISEMYLIRAEARAAAGDLAGAAAAVKALRDVRTGSANTVVYPTAQDAWRGIMNERRIEFAYEGYRFIDIKRLGALAGQGIDRDPADYSSATSNFPGGNPANLPLTSFKWALPIPNVEKDVNTAVQQNPGYN